MNTNQQNLECNKIDKNNEDKMEELRNRLQSIEWDIKQGTFSKDKIPYYKKLLEEYETMREKIERL